MSDDLRYFNESDMDYKNLEYFYNSLPSNRLKIRFRASLNACIANSNVLQGYRGPSHMCNNGSGDSATLNSSNGLQEIRYWWATRKDLNYVPIGGTILYGITRVCEKLGGETDWSSLFFDSATGECLSYDKNDAADELNRRGCEFYAKGDYKKAARYHNNAYRACSSGYRNENEFKLNAEKAESKIRENSRRNSNTNDDDDDDDDDDVTNDDVPSVTRNSRRHRNYNRYDDVEELNNHRQNQEDNALRLLHDGEELFHEARYDQVEDLLREAMMLTNNYEIQSICQDVIMKARNEIQARNLSMRGYLLHRQKNYKEAKQMFEEAYECSRVYERRRDYQRDIAKAQAELDAERWNSEGDLWFEQTRYEQALESYRKAIETTIDNRREYLENMEKTRYEIEAKRLNDNGDDFFRRGNYKQANDEYLRAFNRSIQSSERRKYEANRKKAELEIKAEKLNLQGDEFFIKGNYEEARAKYEQAAMTSKVKCQMYKNNQDKAETEIRAKSMKYQADCLFEQAKYHEAAREYQQAHDTSQVEKERNVYSDNRDKANKLKLLDDLWRQAWKDENDGRCDEAANCFQSVSKEIENGLIRFPGCARLVIYKTLVTLKIEGNEMFNQGVESQNNGVTLLEEAIELEKMDNYRLANEKFQQAMIEFSAARGKFEKGNETDSRFESCIKFVQEQMDQVESSIRITKERIMINELSKLNVNATSNRQTDQHSQIDGNQSNFSAHI